MKRAEHSVGAAIMAVLALGLLWVAYQETWFEYDFTSGRKTAPGGAYTMEGNGVERDALDFSATGWQGDVEPSDADKAQDSVDAMSWGLYAAGGAMLVVLLAEVPGVARILRRRLSLTLITIALAACSTAAALAWLWLPETMAGYGVDSQYTARLDEPDGYTHTAMGWGWYAAAASVLVILAAWFFKFQAGHVDPDDIDEHIRDAEAAA
jgi:hypothetical protein